MEAKNTDQAMEWVAEYDACALWCAERGLGGKAGDPLPELITPEVLEEINGDTDAFEERVREMAYWVSEGKP
jgi:hypothetical protein